MWFLGFEDSEKKVSHSETCEQILKSNTKKYEYPTDINFRVEISCFGMGYQKTEFWITVNFSEIINGNVLLALPFPYSGNKKNGSLTILNSPENTLVYEDARKLKNRELGYNHIDANELWDFYNEEDYGIIVSPIQIGVETHFCYTHKISTMSRLFVPTKLSNQHFMKRPKYTLQISTTNTLKYQNVKKMVNYENGVYSWNEEFWNTHTESVDIWFATSMWDSSDDGEDTEPEEIVENTQNNTLAYTDSENTESESYE